MRNIDTHIEAREPISGPSLRPSDPLLDPSRATRVIQNATSDSGWLVQDVASVEVLSERPERRRTLKFLVNARRAGSPWNPTTWYGQQYRAAEGERLLPMLRFLRAAAMPEIRVPAVLGYSRDVRLLLLAPVEGRPLTGVLEDPIESRVAVSLKRLGRALASFHAIRSPGPSARSTERPSFGRWDGAAESLELEGIENRLRNTGLDARTSDRLRDGIAALRAELEDGTGVAKSPSMVHRQLHPGHIIFGTDGIWMVDLDDASFSEPELDLGALMAHMVLADLKRSTGTRLAPARADSLRAGYLGGGVIRPNRLAAYTSAALLRLAVRERPANGVGASDWVRLTTNVIEEALPELAPTP